MISTPQVSSPDVSYDFLEVQWYVPVLCACKKVLGLDIHEKVLCMYIQKTLYIVYIDSLFCSVLCTTLPMQNAIYTDL